MDLGVRTKTGSGSEPTDEPDPDRGPIFCKNRISNSALKLTHPEYIGHSIFEFVCNIRISLYIGCIINNTIHDIFWNFSNIRKGKKLGL